MHKTNKIKILQIEINSTGTNMHNSKREKNLPAGSFFVDSLVIGKIKIEPKTKQKNEQQKNNYQLRRKHA